MPQARSGLSPSEGHHDEKVRTGAQWHVREEAAAVAVAVAPRRRDDLAEAWIVLAVRTVVVVGGTIAGLVTAHAASEVFARQRVERQSVRAVVLNDVPRTATAPGGATGRRMAAVRWTAPDGSPRTDRTLVTTGLKAGSKAVVRQDGKGCLVPDRRIRQWRRSNRASWGSAAGIALAGLVSGAGAVARWRLDLRRIDR
ncbi:hypothetical protein [Streptomyces sp. NBC_01314]|uniref:Rv1733c family protein n=1 Tax=Streptomyces sp. NBC_01314 TaxID=2903821 RepID=UPI0030860352|nr:hypothetical protein OG622_42555 [Streptomyces sp. NBC_01314]